MKQHSAKLYMLMIAAVITASSCNNANTGTQNTADSVMAKADTVAKDVKQGAETVMNDAKNMVDGNVDSNFVVKAATTNNAELRILQAGLDKATDKELKGHLKMMLADHKKLGSGVKAYSSKKGYVLPDGDNGKADDEMAKLNGMAKGTDYDKELVGHLVSAHEACIDMFEKGQNNVKDPELKTMIGDALPTLHSHLDMMKQMQDKMGK